MKRRILLVDDEIAVLLTLKAVLEISGFDVDTATSGLEGRHKLRAKPYDMVITDMRMEHEQAGRDVVGYARGLPTPPAIALLTAFPVADDDWQEMGADKMLVKPMQTRTLLEQIEGLLEKHLACTGASTPAKAGKKAAKKVAAKKAAKKAVKKAVKKAAKKTVKTVLPAKKAAKKTAVKKKVAAKAVKKAAGKKAAKKR
ncbi:response regulator [Terriglobus sp. 2YAB30_2]|uniref:response regulator n=1 Tax=unclassified Terriglobus TaxID=2628988 RepID=UPI003F9A10FE